YSLIGTQSSGVAMAYAIEVTSLSRSKTAPGLEAMQRALLWTVGLGGAVVTFEPSPYEFATLTAFIVFFATGLRMRLLFLPLLLLLIMINLGYSSASIDLL